MRTFILLMMHLYERIKPSFFQKVIGTMRKREEAEMEKREWLLLSIEERIEPIQLQKMLFKFARESKAPKNELYEFEPYNWGPCSFEIYEDLGILRSEGLIEAVPTGRGWNVYRLSNPGGAVVEELRKKADSQSLGKLDATRKYVISRDFETLLKDVYEDYPEFSKKSLFNT